MDISTVDLVIVLVILLLLFGSSRLPKLSRSIGQSAKELREGFGGPTKTEAKSPSTNPADK